MVNVPAEFREPIRAEYPPNNQLIFEEWFYQHFNKDVSDREYLPIFWTSYLVNSYHAKHKDEVPKLQKFVDELDRSRKYFSIVQYDLGTVVDTTGLDLLLFNMSENKGYPLPLLCNPQPFKFSGEKKYFANFIGNMTHPIRRSCDYLIGRNGYYISLSHHGIEDYCRIISESIFTLCFRGFGSNSFRIQEALQYGSIPVYISDEIINAHNVPFESYGVVIHAEDAHRIDEILKEIPNEEIIKKQDKLQEVFERYYTFESNHALIVKHLQDEAIG